LDLPQDPYEAKPDITYSTKILDRNLKLILEEEIEITGTLKRLSRDIQKNVQNFTKHIRIV
jgi:hypothetical protein